ncbi:MAG: hypothetical protein ACP5NS_01575 [Candidatus Pacearchaeota archaeon]
MNVLIVGSTGMVGSKVLAECITNKKINKIYLMNRRKSDIPHKKITEIINPDFLNFDSIKLPKVDVCFYTIGVYQGLVPKDTFIEVTYKYIQSFVKALKKRNITFCLLSAQGANQKSLVLFAKWKGEAEKVVRDAKFKKTYLFRPGYIHPTNQPEKKTLLFYKLLYSFYPVINFLFPGHCVELNKLAKTMVYVGIKGSDKFIFENKDIRNLKIT